MEKVKIGITTGDLNGIGPEIIIKALSNSALLENCIPVVYGSSKVISYYKNVVKRPDFSFQSLQNAERLRSGKVYVLNCMDEVMDIAMGRATEEGGQFAYTALDRAVRDLKEGLIDTIVTCPINKSAMRMANFPAKGHTEFLQESLGGNALMVMVSDTMRLGLVTTHIPLSEVAGSITRDSLQKALLQFIDTLRLDFGFEKPAVAVLGLNPHASDSGIMGAEEEEILTPVIETFKEKGHLVMGPYPADGFFGSGQYAKFDGILAMYHDQGLIPFKALSFGRGVNLTAGLSHIRTSPDHGTAYDIVGQGIADDGSLREALYLAIDLFRQRKEAVELAANSLNPQDFAVEMQKIQEEGDSELPVDESDQ